VTDVPCVLQTAMPQIQRLEQTKNMLLGVRAEKDTLKADLEAMASR
jgi:hypothetical protein